MWLRNPAFLLAMAIALAGTAAAEIPDEASLQHLSPDAEEPLRLRLSPQISLAMPQPLAIGIEAWKAGESRWRGFSSLGYLPVSFGGGSKSLSIFSLQAGARYFPWKKGFFGSFALGYRHIGFDADTSTFKIEDEVLATNGLIDLYTVFTGISAGAEFPLSSKLSFSFDLGLQVPLIASGRMTLRNDLTGETSATSEVLSVGDPTAMSRVARLLVPQITLFRLTWFLD